MNSTKKITKRFCKRLKPDHIRSSLPCLFYPVRILESEKIYCLLFSDHYSLRFVCCCHFVVCVFTRTWWLRLIAFIFTCFKSFVLKTDLIKSKVDLKKEMKNIVSTRHVFDDGREKVENTRKPVIF